MNINLITFIVFICYSILHFPYFSPNLELAYKLRSNSEQMTHNHIGTRELTIVSLETGSYALPEN